MDSEKDAAWVTIETRARPSEVQRFCASVERLFRINPHLQIRSWREPEPHLHRVELRNLSNGREESFSIAVSRPSGNVLLLAYADRLKRSTAIELEPCAGGTRVRITDDYSGPAESERIARSGEVDRSLTAWGHALSAYLERERRYGRFALWHTLLDRVWLPMSPMGRRITLVLLAISVAEVAVLALIALVAWAESRGAF